MVGDKGRGARLLAAYARLIVRRAPWVMAATLVVSGLFASQLSRITTRFDPDSVFPPADPAVRIDREIREEFGGRNVVIIAVVPRSGAVWQPRVLAAVKDITRDVLALPDVIAKDVVSLAAPAVRVVEEGENGRIVEDYLMREVPRTPEAIARVRARYESNPLYRGSVVSEDGKAALVIADFWPGATAEGIAAGIRAILDRHRSPELALHATGEPMIMDAEHRYLHRLPIFFVATVGVMMLVLFVSFRTFQGMLLPLLTGLLATLWGLGLMGRLGIPIGVWNQSVPVLVVIVAAGHSAQMLKRYYEELAAGRSNAEAVSEALVKVGPVMVAAGATAALGFASLAFIGIPGMRDMGLAAAFGIGSAVVLELSFMPALRSRVRPGQVRARTDGTRGLLGLLASCLLSRLGRAAILALAAVTVALAAAAMPRIEARHSMYDYLPEGSRATRDFHAVRAHFPGTVTLTVLFAGEPGMAKEPRVLAAMDGLARVLAAEPEVVRALSLADLVKQLHRVFSPDHSFALPRTRPLLAQLLYLGYSPAFERFVDRGYARAVVWAYLRSDDSDVVRRVLGRARAYVAGLDLPGVEVKVAGGVGPMNLALQDRVTRGKTLNMAVLLAVIFVIASAVLRTPVGGAYVVLPLFLTLIVNFGILGWFGIRFDLVSASVIAVGVGIGADYAIYFLYRLREEYRTQGGALEPTLRRALDTSGRAVVFVAVSIALGFATFTASSFLAFRLSGILTPATMLVSCGAAISVLPALLLTARPAFLFGQAGERRRGRGPGGSAGRGEEPGRRVAAASG